MKNKKKRVSEFKMGKDIIRIELRPVKVEDIEKPAHACPKDLGILPVFEAVKKPIKEILEGIWLDER